MKTENIRVYFISGFKGGVVRCGVVIGEEHNGKTIREIDELKKKKGYKEAKHYVLELDYLAQRIEKELKEKGYTTSITSRQKYPRISFNA